MSKVNTVLIAVTIALVSAGCGGAGRPETASGVSTAAGVHFAKAPATLITRCRRTAQQVGYRVPCPTLVPTGLKPFGGRKGCMISIIGPAPTGTDCGQAWRGWVVGSSTAAGGLHLVIQAAPKVVPNLTRAVDGPGYYAGAAVRPLRNTRVGNSPAKEVFVPPGTNDGSAFAGHIVLIWTAGGHTYAIGFHDTEGTAKTRLLNAALVSGIRLIS